MSITPPELSSSLRLPSGLKLPNRIAKAAMTEALAGTDDQPNRGHAELYRRWSVGGAGLLVTGNVMVDRRYLERPGNVVFDADTNPEAARAWAEACRTGGSRTLVQLNHPGRQTNRFVASKPVAPSAVGAVRLLGAFAKPRALDGPEVEGIVRRFANAAMLAERAGFDGVQIHAAHGYLVSQFLSPLTNRRSDVWGGDLDGRSRFLVEIVRAVRVATHDGFTLAVKLNSADFQRGGLTHEDSLSVVRRLEDEGVDLLEISGGSYESMVMFGGAKNGTRGEEEAKRPRETARRESTRRREAYFLEYARDARRVTSTLPLMLTGGFRSHVAMAEALADGAIDLIGLARPLAVEPDLPNRLLSGSANGAAEHHLRAPRHAALAGVAQGGWYGEQMRRMARGEDPDPELGLLSPMLHDLVGDAGRALRRRWRASP